MLDGCRIMPGKVKDGLMDQSNVPVAPITARRISSEPPQVRWRAGRGAMTPAKIAGTIGAALARHHSNSRSSPTNCSNGSGTVTVFMKLHLGHSKMRFSLRSGAGDTRANIIRVRQREQYGRSMGIRDKVMAITSDRKGALSNFTSCLKFLSHSGLKLLNCY